MIEHIGIIGGGQLGRMLTEAAKPLGFEVTVLDGSLNCPASQAGANQIVGNIQDHAAIEELAEITDVVTWEIEHINADVLEELVKLGHNIQPSPSTLGLIQDKFRQKLMLQNAGLPVAPGISLEDFDYTAKSKLEALTEVQRRIGTALILKSRTGAYDGRCNHVYNNDISEIDRILGEDWTRLYAEQMVSFTHEISVIVARDMEGNTAFYPTVETIQQDNICHTVLSPAAISPHIERQAQKMASETLNLLLGAGVFAIEMFATDEGVVVNEIAPRVHNSGHHTIEANVTSQFEQHIRAITGMPLGSTAMRSPAAAMINILGSREEPLSREGLDHVLARPDAHPHFYGKSSRKARKIGHITILGDSITEVLQQAQQARKELVI